MSQKLKLDLFALREKWRKLPDYGCFWSSPDNPKGLQLTPTIEVGKVSVEMLVEREHSGIPGIAHGGIAFTIIDGLMGWYIMSHEGRVGFTTKATTKYFAPLRVGQTYLFEVKSPELPVCESPINSIRLVGTVYQKNVTPEQQKPMVQIEAEFILPNRSMAQKILGIELSDELKELFPL